MGRPRRLTKHSLLCCTLPLNDEARRGVAWRGVAWPRAAPISTYHRLLPTSGRTQRVVGARSQSVQPTLPYHHALIPRMALTTQRVIPMVMT